MTYILIVASLFYFSILLFLFVGFFKNKNEQSNYWPKVSVIVAARNEELNLPNCLNSLINQTYPVELTQILIVDDRSSDSTAKIIDRFSLQYPNISKLSIFQTPEKISPKKHALSEGIAQATGDLIFTTDADCVAPRQWLSETIPLFRHGVGLVFGAAPFIEPQNLSGKILSLDNLATTLVAAGAAGWGLGVTCTGRNLAYRKAAFVQVNGFSGINHSLSGDDDLFLQTVKRQTNWEIVFSMNPKTAVVSHPAPSFSAYVAQRRRHVSASKYYPQSIQIAYLAFNLANIALFGFLLFSILQSEFFSLAIMIFALKLIVDFISLSVVAKRFAKRSLLYFFPLWEIFFLLNQILVSPLGLMGKIKWK